ncbi:sensor histidine kinase [Caenimonas koreensis]|uniref:Sensor histidine kinase n=1 Tax=Caenimonas koreensis DSM 17982 TaxID=1121255 RepID=A0A844B7K4_9BURK|nr:histidine kinase [Caenimonas koreensis]MRD49142.1 sensor histidine kinase [Caenimonas koreensis DSM 17982]
MNSGLRSLLPARRQLAVVVAMALSCAVLLLFVTRNTFIELAGEMVFVGVTLLFAFTASGAWHQQFAPKGRVQVAAVLLAAVVAPLVVHMVNFGGDFAAFARSRPHVNGYFIVVIGAAIIGTLFALAALYSERDAQAQAQALEFALERETLQRQAADARLHLMTAQIQPHFLLNTLANVQELVESGSARAVPVFRSLIDYLRAAMPHLQPGASTLGDEERLVRAYLDLMHMRMPDRLQFAVDVDPALRGMRFPPMALLTLVENAIKHGIDPACDGGRVEVGAQAQLDGRIHLWVADTGVGIAEHGQGAGMGLANLNARLAAFFGEGSHVELSEQQPSGVRADVRVRPASERAS